MRHNAMDAGVIARVPHELPAGHHDRRGIRCAGLLARQRLSAHDPAIMAAGMNRRRGMGATGAA